MGAQLFGRIWDFRACRGIQGVQHPWCERFKLQSADNAEFVLTKSEKTSVPQRIQSICALGVLVIEDLIIL